MRVGFVFGGRYDPVALGGNAVDIREDLAGMQTLGHEVAFRSYETGPLAVPGLVRDVKLRIPPVLWETARNVALFRRDRHWRALLESDDSLRPSELVFEYWSPDSFAGGRFAQALSVPHLLENLDPITDERHAVSRSLLSRRLVAAERARRQAASALIVMSRAMGDYLVSEWGVDAARVHWLPQGVNTELFTPQDDGVRSAARVRLDPDGRKIVGFVGSLADYQRVDVLVDAMRLLAQERDDVRLVLVGGTPERARGLGADDIATVLSHVPYEDVPRLVSAFDVAVLPDSNWYGSPVKVLEYASVGVPVVAPDVAPVRDLMADPDDGLLVPPGDPVALAAAIARVLDNTDDASARARHFSSNVRTNFGRRERTTRLLALCTSLVEGSG